MFLHLQDLNSIILHKREREGEREGGGERERNAGVHGTYGCSKYGYHLSAANSNLMFLTIQEHFVLS
jgi:hypothetical protein